MDKKGFTLIELLAVIVVLAIILAIAIPSITGIINSARKGSFESDAKMVLQAVKYKKLEDDSFNPLLVTKDNIQEKLGLSGDKYTQVKFSMEEELTLILVGTDKWNGFTACGTIQDMKVVESVADCNTDIIAPNITLLGEDPVNIYEREIYNDPGTIAIDNKDGNITSSVVSNGIVEIRVPGTYTITYSVSDKAGNIAAITRTVNVIGVIYSYDYTGAYQTFTAPVDGNYKIELWGAQGGIIKNYSYTKGGYTTGTIYLTAGTTMYVYVGGAGSYNGIRVIPNNGGYNGGGNGGHGVNHATYTYFDGASGGGATDVRLSSGLWNDKDGLKSRIMVAGGGGGDGSAVGVATLIGGGFAGGLTGQKGSGVFYSAGSNYTLYGGDGGTQTTPTTNFGIGSVGDNSGLTTQCNGHSGGGGGYYGGAGGKQTGGDCFIIGGGGGSSFISGYSGCNAVNAAGTHTGQANHYSGLVFSDAVMIAGNANMTDPAGEAEIGHVGSGYARITNLDLVDYPPTITIIGNNPATFEVEGSYTDMGATATDEVDGDITNKIVTTTNLNPNVAGTYEVIYSITDSWYNTERETRTVIVEPKVYSFDYTGLDQTFTVPLDGNYKIELWGAQGGSPAGFGGYVTGDTNLSAGTNLYIYVGQKGTYGSFGINATSTVGKGAVATFNGGGAGGNAGGGSYPYASYQGGSSGGGATDVRLANGPWQTTASLVSRIMVAGGGGGGNPVDVNYDSSKGNSGGLTGEKGGLYAFMIGKPVYATDVTKRGLGGTQTTGYAFGTGEKGDNTGIAGYCSGHSAGGGGYYGGTGGKQTGGNCHMIGGGGGSSFISGYSGCNAVNASGVHTGQPNHYSGYVFTSAQMIAGSGSMPSPTYSTETGHAGNGYARISYLGK